MEIIGRGTPTAANVRLNACMLVKILLGGNVLLSLMLLFSMWEAAERQILFQRLHDNRQAKSERDMIISHTEIKGQCKCVFFLMLLFSM